MSIAMFGGLHIDLAALKTAENLRESSGWAIQYNTIQYNTIQYNTIQCNAMQCNAMQCNAMQCNAMQCNAMQCNAMQCNTIQYNTISAALAYMAEVAYAAGPALQGPRALGQNKKMCAA